MINVLVPIVPDFHIKQNDIMFAVTVAADDTRSQYNLAIVSGLSRHIKLPRLALSGKGIIWQTAGGRIDKSRLACSYE